MSMYNAVVGYDPCVVVALKLCGINSAEDAKALPRFRDAYLDPEKREAVIFTRTGGGNRADFEEGNAKIKSMPNFVDDHDDDFDSTFAHWRFSVEGEENIATFDEVVADGNNAGWEWPKPMDRFKKAVEAINSPKA